MDGSKMEGGIRTEYELPPNARLYELPTIVDKRKRCFSYVDGAIKTSRLETCSALKPM
jgi:hypothetical protein